MKIAFYLETMGNRIIDVSNPELGNPGMGGTQFQMILLAHFLSIEKPDWQIFCLAENEIKFGGRVNHVKINNDNTTQIIIDLNINILLVPNSRLQNIKNMDLPKNINIITRSGNAIDHEYLHWIENNKNIKANVFVGKHVYDHYLDCNIIKKSKCIFNMVPDPCGHDITRDIDSKIVVYMGSLVRAKGFLELARMWKDIVKAVPGAKLYVIGSGKLYNCDAELGPHGLADKNYENEFAPYVSDGKGILPSVNFMGVLGKEKYDVFRKSCVGVANPTGVSEVFCSTVIEMNCAALPVVTIKNYRFFDVIKNKETGFLGKNNKEIKEYIIKLLTDSEINRKLGQSAKTFAGNFSTKIAMPKWIGLFEQVQNGTFKPDYDPPGPPFITGFKWLRIINRFLRFNCRLSFLPPIMMIKPFLKGLIQRKNDKY